MEGAQALRIHGSGEHDEGTIKPNKKGLSMDIVFMPLVGQWVKQRCPPRDPGYELVNGGRDAKQRSRL